MKVIWYGIRSATAYVVEAIFILLFLPLLLVALVVSAVQRWSLPTWASTLGKGIGFLLKGGFYLLLWWLLHSFGQWGMRP